MDREKGAVEADDPDARGNTSRGNTSMSGQLGHRDQDPLIKSSDTDFPEPGENPEHSGEPESNLLAREDDYREEPAEVNSEATEQDPVRRRKQTPGQQKAA